MTSIDGIDALAALMRQQVRSLRQPATDRAPAMAPLAPQPQKRRNAGSGQDLASVVSRRVRALDQADPDAPRKAFRIFLEAVMQAELGDAVINDAAFHGLVEDVIAQMATDAALAEAMARAARLLLARAGVR